MLTQQKRQSRTLNQLKKTTLENIDFSAYYRMLLGDLRAPDRNGYILTICPFHEDTNPSLSINIQTGLFKCHGCNTRGDIYDFSMKFQKVDFTTAVSDLAQYAGVSTIAAKQKTRITKTYDYTDQSGELIFQVCRHEPKKFSQRRPNGKGGWIWNLKNIDVLPYRLHQLTKADTVFICEGEKDCDRLYDLGITATCNPMGAGKWRKSFNDYFLNKEVFILPDNDDPGQKHALNIANNLFSIVHSVKIVQLPNLPKKGDVSDWLESGNTREDLFNLAKKTGNFTAVEEGLKVVSIFDFLKMDLPPRENILAPWLPTQGVCMIHAQRGAGKTHIALGIACSVAAGTAFLRWKAPKPTGVLLLDGEMPASALQERLKNIVDGMSTEIKAPLDIITPDLQSSGMPDIGTQEGQITIEKFITSNIKLVIVDNISTLVRSGRENEAEGWLPVQEWALKLRSRGKSVLFIHHSSKQGLQRGTSKREDILDTVISLRHPSGYKQEDGACFEVHFEKNRGIQGDDVKPFEAKLISSEDSATSWSTRSIEDSTYIKILNLTKEGLTQQEISQELDIHKSTVSRHLKKARETDEINVSQT